jgi:hypothetical protein
MLVGDSGQAGIGRERGSLPFTPEASEALAELRALGALAARDVDVANGVRDFFDKGAPFLRADVDTGPAVGAGKRIVRYHLADDLRGLLSAFGARNIDPKRGG